MKKSKILQNNAFLTFTLLSLDVSWWGKSRFVAHITRGPLNYAHYRRDVIDQLGRHCIACVFVDYFEFSRD